MNLLDFIQKNILLMISKPLRSLLFYFDLFLVTPHDRTIGNTAEEIHAALIYAQEKGKRVIFLRRYVIGGAPKIPNFRIFRLRGDGIASGAFPSIIQFAANCSLTLLGHSFGVAKWIIVNIRIVPVSIFAKYFGGKNTPIAYLHYRSCLLHLDIGHELIWRGSFATNPEEKYCLSESSFNWSGKFLRPVDINFEDNETAYFRNFLRSIGLKEGDWYVCLHNREPGYHRDQLDFRNSSIENYQKGIDRILAAGGRVVRMGDPSMTKLPKKDGLIDYPFTKFKSEILDLLLVKNCRFYIGQNSGLVDVAYLFQKRCLLVNSTEWAIGFPRLDNSRVVFKHFFSKRDGRFLSVRELLMQPFSIVDLHQVDRALTLEENTSEEIDEAIREFLEPETKFTGLQRDFVNLRVRQVEGWLKEEIYRDLDQDRKFKFRLRSRMMGCLGTGGRAFLEQNWEKNSH